MAAIGSPTVPCYFDEKGVAKQCARDMNKLAYTFTGTLYILISPDGSDNNVDAQYDEIINGVATASRTKPLYSINGAMRLAARFSIPHTAYVVILCKDGTYTWTESQGVHNYHGVTIQPLVMPTSRPAISTRSVKFVFNSTSTGASTTLSVEYANLYLICINLTNNTQAGAVVSPARARVVISGCVLYGAQDGVDGQQYECTVRSYLIGDNRTYDEASAPDRTTAIETYIYGQTWHGIESDVHSLVSIYGWVRINHTSTAAYALAVPLYGRLQIGDYKTRLDIKESNSSAAYFGIFGNINVTSNATIGCNLDEASFSTLAKGDTTKLYKGFFGWEDGATYTKVTNPIG